VSESRRKGGTNEKKKNRIRENIKKSEVGASLEKDSFKLAPGNNMGKSLPRGRRAEQGEETVTRLSLGQYRAVSICVVSNNTLKKHQAFILGLDQEANPQSNTFLSRKRQDEKAHLSAQAQVLVTNVWTRLQSYNGNIKIRQQTLFLGQGTGEEKGTRDN